MSGCADSSCFVRLFSFVLVRFSQYSVWIVSLNHVLFFVCPGILVRLNCLFRFKLTRFGWFILFQVAYGCMECVSGERVVRKIVQSCFFLLCFVFICSTSLCLFLLLCSVFLGLCFVVLGCCSWFVLDCFALFSLFFCVLSAVVSGGLEASSLRKLFCFSMLSVDVFLLF